MKTTRLTDWLKLAPLFFAAATLVGCASGTDETTAPPTDEAIGADTSAEDEFEAAGDDISAAAEHAGDAIEAGAADAADAAGDAVDAAGDAAKDAGNAIEEAADKAASELTGEPTAP